jgi:predicted transcriptional regulator
MKETAMLKIVNQIKKEWLKKYTGDKIKHFLTDEVRRSLVALEIMSYIKNLVMAEIPIPISDVVKIYDTIIDIFGLNEDLDKMKNNCSVPYECVR